MGRRPRSGRNTSVGSGSSSERNRSRVPGSRRENRCLSSRRVELPTLSRKRGGLGSSSGALGFYLNINLGRPRFKVAKESWAEPAFGIELA
jgi:hypothetical protein